MSLGRPVSQSVSASFEAYCIHAALTYSLLPLTRGSVKLQYTRCFAMHLSNQISRRICPAISYSSYSSLLNIHQPYCTYKDISFQHSCQINLPYCTLCIPKSPSSTVIGHFCSTYVWVCSLEQNCAFLANLALLFSGKFGIKTPSAAIAQTHAPSFVPRQK